MGWVGCFGCFGCLVGWVDGWLDGCLGTELDEVFWVVVLVTELELPYSNHSTIESGRANI